MFQYVTQKLYRVLNPDKDTFNLKGRNHVPATKGKIWYIVCDEDRYQDKLLHCTININEAKCFAVSKEKTICDSMKVLEIQMHGKRNRLVEDVHV